MKIIKELKNKLIHMPVTAKAALVYVIASFITRAFHLITTPLFTRIMSVSQIGEVSNFSTWQSFISDVVTLGLCSGAINIALKDYRDDRLGFIKSSQFLILLSVLIGAIITVICYPIISPILGMPFHYIILMFVMIYFGTSKSFWISLNRYEFHYKGVGILTIASSILTAGISVLAVIYASNKGYEDLSSVRIYASSAVTLSFCIPICLKFFINKKPLVKKEYCVFAFTIGTPMIVHTLSKTVLSASDRVMINAMSGPEALGYYSVLYTLASIIIIVWDSINASLVPYIFGKLDGGKEAEEDIRKMSATMLVVFAVVSLLMILFAPEIVWIVASEKYLKSVYIMPPISIGIFFTSLYSLYANIIMYHKKTNWIMTATTGAAVFNLITNFVFIKMFGYVAAAYTTLASYVLLAVIYCVCSKKVHGYSVYSNKQFWGIGMVLTVVGLLCSLLYINTVVRYVIIGIILTLIIIFRKKAIESYKIIRNK